LSIEALVQQRLVGRFSASVLQQVWWSNKIARKKDQALLQPWAHLGKIRQLGHRCRSLLWRIYKSLAARRQHACSLPTQSDWSQISWSG